MSGIPVLELSEAELDDVSGGCGPLCLAAVAVLAAAALRDWLRTAAGQRATAAQIQHQREIELARAYAAYGH
jgi:lactobin A/cerein 7B family class IIb bacteriocin